MKTTLFIAILALTASLTLVASPRVQFNYVNFGAIPDNEACDAAALTRALEHLMERGGGTLLVPSGRYTFKERVVVKGSFERLRIQGMGHSLSRFISANPDGILKIEAENADAVIEVLDMDFPPAMRMAGTALEFIKPYSEPDGVDYNLLLQNLELRPEWLETDFFDHVFVADGFKVLIDNVNTSGVYGPKFNVPGGKALKYEAESIIKLRNAYQPRIHYSNLWAAKYGIDIELTDAHLEPTIYATVSVETETGIIIRKIGDQPLSHPLRIQGSHWNNAILGLLLENVDGFRIVQNCLYGAHDLVPEYKDIKLVNSSNGEFIDNSFWWSLIPRTCFYIDQNSHNISIRNTHFGRNVAVEPIIVEKGARNIDVRNNIYGTVYAMDEGDTFGLWEMEETEVNQALDKDRLQPGRANHLRLEGAHIAPGDSRNRLGDALWFRGPNDTAVATSAWSSTEGVRINLHLLIGSGLRSIEESTILEVPGVYRLYLADGDLCFDYVDRSGEVTTLAVPRVGLRHDWIPVLVEIHPELNRAVLEVSGTGGDRRFVEDARLARASGPFSLAPVDSKRKFVGAVDQLWIQRLTR